MEEKEYSWYSLGPPSSRANRKGAEKKKREPLPRAGSPAGASEPRTSRRRRLRGVPGHQAPTRCATGRAGGRGLGREFLGELEQQQLGGRARPTAVLLVFLLVGGFPPVPRPLAVSIPPSFVPVPTGRGFARGAVLPALRRVKPKREGASPGRCAPCPGFLGPGSGLAL